MIANQQRAERAALLRRLQDGELTVRVLFDLVDQDGPGSVAGRTRLKDLLVRIPQIGPVRAERVLADVELTGDRRLSTLTAAQRERVITTALAATQSRQRRE